MKIVFWFICLCALTACGKSPSKTPHIPDTAVVKLANIHKSLYFTGTIQPLHESTITSPADAVIQSMHFHYGQSLKKGDIVFTLNSAELQRQYNDTLTEYLKAKDTYTIAKAKFSGTEDLWKEGLVAKNNYLSERSSLNTARITLMQATHKLSVMLDKMGEADDEALANLSFAQFDRVRLALARQHNLIHLKAPGNGILLYPPKTSGDQTRLNTGSTVKSGQVLALMGDLSGVSVEIDVPEVDIAEIKPGMPAMVRGIAFGKQALQGTLIAINAQASSTTPNALPSFTAIVEVKSLTAEQRSLLKVGMSADVELNVNTAKKLLIPMAALQQKNGKSTVEVRKKNGDSVMQTVVTGSIQNHEVIIESGLNVGDVVVICH